MKNTPFSYKYLLHRLDAKNTRGYGIHSPYLYRFTQNAIHEKNPFYAFKPIEEIRANLLHDNRLLSFKALNTGKKRGLKVRQIAGISLKHPKWGQLLYRIVHFTNAKTVLELGTSLGIGTAYLASPATDICCVTLEESAQLADIALENFGKLDIGTRVSLVVGNIHETLPQQLAGMDKLDVVYINVNRRKDAVLKFFSQCVEHIHAGSVFIIDDIHCSPEMRQAWHTIRMHEKVTACIDLFEVGIVFFSKNYPKKKFKMVL